VPNRAIPAARVTKALLMGRTVCPGDDGVECSYGEPAPGAPGEGVKSGDGLGASNLPTKALISMYRFIFLPAGVLTSNTSKVLPPLVWSFCAPRLYPGRCCRIHAYSAGTPSSSVLPWMTIAVRKLVPSRIAAASDRGEGNGCDDTPEAECSEAEQPEARRPSSAAATESALFTFVGTTPWCDPR
jgi:hypothetical protein